MKNNKVKENSIRHFNSNAKEYDKSFDGKFVEVMYNSLIEEISKEDGGKLLDIGCGNGNVLSQLVNQKRLLYGIDLSEIMVEECRKKMGQDAEIVVADAEHIPFEDNMFNTILCNASFHHYPNPNQVLKEIKRVIKNGGRLLIGEGYTIQPFRTLLNLSFRFSNSGDFHSYGKNELITMLRYHGFQIIKVRRTSNHTMLYVAIV